MIARKKRGRLTSGKGVLIGVRLQPAQLAALDAWLAVQPDVLTRPEAIRRLVDEGLAGKAQKGPVRKAKAEKAAELAARVIETKTDKTQPVEEQKSRKRKLISGPTEFRDMRRDQPNGKS